MAAFIISGIWIRSKRLRGVEFLTESDHLIMFYSAACMKISAEYMDTIKESGCKFSIYKLKRQNKNALDIYIATEAGRLSALGHTHIAVITKDKGFKSIVDFFSINEALSTTKIVVCEDIARGLNLLNDPNDAERCNAIQKKMKIIDLKVEYGRMQEANAIREKIAQLLQDTEYKPMTENIIKFFLVIKRSLRRICIQELSTNLDLRMV